MRSVSMYEYLNRLNPQQKEAATTIDGRLLILAGAGSGKTATLISRVAYMLDNGIAPDNILLLTFTNKAAKEMKDRAEKMIGENAQKITACTFHSFCANICRRYAKVLDLPHNFNILDSADTKDIMDIARQEFLEAQEKKGINYNLKRFPKTGTLLTVHENVINNLSTLPHIIAQMELTEFEDEIKRIDDNFTSYKEIRGLVDYNDLLMYVVSLLRNNEHIRSSMDEHYKYIACDEYQDTNHIQNEILNLLTRDYQNLAVVGDDNQSIYAWRSADIRNILEFSDIYPDCKSVVLYENYRSSQEILDFANAVMENAEEGIKKELHGQFHGQNPFYVETKDNFTESKYICEEIQNLHEDGIPYKEMAVMIRNARLSTVVETDLMRLGIPFKKFGGIKFLERAAVKDVLAFVKIMSNDKDELAWFRILQQYPGVGKTYAKKIATAISIEGIGALLTMYSSRSFAPYLIELNDMISAHKYNSLVDYIDYITKDYYPYLIKRKIQSMNKKSNVEKTEMTLTALSEIKETEVLSVLAEKYKNAEDFLADIVLDAIVEEDDDDDYVNITTVHSAKGLEYEAVFFMDLIDEIMPGKCDSKDKENEELRVFYVGITRAKRFLYLMVPEKFKLGPFIDAARCSPFMLHENVFDVLGIPMPEYHSFWF